MNVTVVFAPRERTPNQENISNDQIDWICRALRNAGFTPAVVSYTPDAFAAGIIRQQPDLLLNLVYGYVSADRRSVMDQPATTESLEQLGIPMTGASYVVQRLAQDKVATAAALAQVGIRSPAAIPDEAWAISADVAVWKPRRGSCHRGVRLVQPGTSLAELRASNAEEYMLQEYVDGEEFTLSVLEDHGVLTVLPRITIDFVRDTPPHRLMIWGEYFYGFKPEPVGPELEAFATTIFRAIGLRDYARIDVRRDKLGPVTLDVNALPNLDPASSLFPMAAAAAGISFDELIFRIVRSALARAPVPRREAN